MNWKIIIAALALFATVVGGVWALDARIKAVTSEEVDRSLGARLGRIEQKLDDMSNDFQQIKNRFFRGSQKAGVAR